MAKRTRKKTQVSIVGVFGSIGLIAALMLPIRVAGAAPDHKTFKAFLNPAPTSSTATFDLTLVNDTLNQGLGSVDLYIPAGLTISLVDTTPESGGTATYVPGSITYAGVTYAATIKLRGLPVPPASVSTSDWVIHALFTASTSCAGGEFTFGIRGKQDNEFNGTGNDFQYVGSPLTVTFPASGCALRWKTQPQDEEKNAIITGVDAGSQRTPPDPSRPQVELYDPATNQVVDSYSGNISVALTQSSGNLGGTTTVPASAGVATFTNLTVANVGTYQLVASSPAAASSVLSEWFEIAESLTYCAEDTDCTTEFTGNNGTTYSITAEANDQDLDEGILTAALTAGGLDCSYADGTPYEEFSYFTASFFYDRETRSFTVVGTVPKQYFNDVADNGAAHLEFCLGASKPFLREDLSQAPLDQGTGDYVGLLPTCNKFADPTGKPCIVAQYKQGADAIIVVTIPGVFHGALDPKGRY